MNLLLQAKSWLFVSEKINSVMAILLTIFAGIVVYLVLTNRKISKLEEQIKDQDKG